MLRITKQKSVTISNSSGHIHIHSLGSAHASYYQNIPHFRNRCHLHESFPSHTYARDLSLGIYHHSSGLLQESSSFSPGSHSSKYHLASHQIVRTQLGSGQSLQRLPTVQVKSKPHHVALNVTGGLAGLQPCPSSRSSSTLSPSGFDYLRYSAVLCSLLHRHLLCHFFIYCSPSIIIKSSPTVHAFSEARTSVILSNSLRGSNILSSNSVRILKLTSKSIMIVPSCYCGCWYMYVLYVISFYQITTFQGRGSCLLFLVLFFL